MVEARTFLLAFLVFSGVIIGMTSFYGELFNNYGYTADDISYLTVAENITTQTKDIENTLRTSWTGLPIVDETIAFISGALKAVGLMFSTVDMATITVYALSNELKLPDWVPGIIISAIIIMLVFVVISAYLKHKV